MTRFTVAIDGPAAAGKGTISRGVARKFGFQHLDTGLLYRATGRRVLRGEDPVLAAQGLQPDDLFGDDLRSGEVAQSASRVAAIPAVRTALVEFQRAFARRTGGAVLDGRDIGTVICPDADVKLYVTASDKVRAERRYKELAAAGADVTLQSVLADLAERDARDAGRDTAPTKQANDAFLLDTSEMTIQAALSAAVDFVAAVYSRGD
ncbi:MAG: cytidylate kinase [Marinosulfonomonas sp.]|nr:cytidylate kinase [Marinosulfonomonas sp.]